jgi:hypothetical protein
MKIATLVFTIVLAASCANVRQPEAEPFAARSEFRNLQVLPRDIPREELLQTMRSFTRGLGVRCNHCHVVTATEPEEQLDFPSDAKEEKRAARVMLQMAMQINGPWMARVEQAEHAGEDAAREDEENEEESAEADEGPRVSCWTCHRGKPEPEAPPAPAPADR